MGHIASWIWVLIPLAAIYFKFKRDELQHRAPRDAGGAEADQLRAEVRALKERIAVLERIATDDGPAKALAREIDTLR